MNLILPLAVDGWAVTFCTATRGQGGTEARPGPSSLYQMYETVHPSTANVPITILLYNGPLLCGFNVSIKMVKLWPNYYLAPAVAGAIVFLVAWIYLFLGKNAGNGYICCRETCGAGSWIVPLIFGSNPSKTYSSGPN